MIALPAVVVASIAAGCGGSASPAAGNASPGAVTTSAAPASAAPPVTSATPAGASTTVAACAVADLKPSLTLQPQVGTGDTHVALLQLTNVSSHSCEVRGWAVVALVNAANEVVPVPTTNVSQPGAPVPADLRPGTAASAGIKWISCDKSSDSCPTGNTIKVGLTQGGAMTAADLNGFPDPAKSDLTMKSLQVGTVQPSTQGVVAW